MKRGRPPIRRAQVLTYWRKHGPCPIMHVARALGCDRATIYRIFRAAQICPVGRHTARNDAYPLFCGPRHPYRCLTGFLGDFSQFDFCHIMRAENMP